MAGAITSIPKFLAARLPHYLGPSGRSHRAVQAVFKRFQSSLASIDMPMGAPKSVYPGHPEFHFWERSAEFHKTYGEGTLSLKRRQLQQIAEEEPDLAKEVLAMKGKMDAMGKGINRLNHNVQTLIQLFKDSQK